MWLEMKVLKEDFAQIEPDVRIQVALCIPT